MDIAAQMLQFPQFGLVQGCADADPAHRAIGTGLPVRLASVQKHLHAPLQHRPGTALNRAPPGQGLVKRIAYAPLDANQ